MNPKMQKLLATVVLTTTASVSHAFQDGKIVIWGAGEARGQAAWEAIGQKFEEETGVGLVIESPDPVPDKFQQAAATGDGPDLIFFAHDRFGEWASSGLLSPIEISDEVRSNIEDIAWDGVTVGKSVYGYPIFAEAASLIYNKKLIKNAPSSFEEILAGVDMPEGVAPILWDYNNAYFSFPLLAANGGYAFKKVNGVYDPAVTGVNNAGAIQGGEMIKSLIDHGMATGVDYGIMSAEFSKNKVAMVIDGPWAWENYEKAGIDFGLAPIPTINGSPAKPFVGIWSIGVNAASPNKDLVKLLMESYVLTDDALKALVAADLNGAMVDKSVAATQAADERISITLQNAIGGVPMPNNSEMGSFWSAMAPALGNITSGRQPVKEALDNAAARILGE
ncbi:maltose/maltodextrin ABC transporter substrate-binding protein MalE [Marinobacterium sedimentorum]|uniref:maltose/maltodextrin ABC transporter substrate-binding protein MalE n=1 Tax=Marinobacterium sedimentorum TaxID=2927804 RepID=UPI0020C6CF34|nr:maltose/maltodextrin ABC transporter substrate-binding protein MalE [Marinobacterium sedimentorum]MCP8690200.1 maltose/maltodextrin ABC transporter substrate-binding protein MalE [Marinobacterium sedimentorum]